MPNGKIDKEWAGAVRKAVREMHESEDETGKIKKIRYINVLASRLVEAASNGDITAIKEVGDRLDGKPAQAVAFSGNVKVTKVTEQFVMPDGIEDTDAVRIPTTH